MLKIPDISAHLRKYNHSKKESAVALLAQIGEFHLQRPPYNAPYNSFISTPFRWWKMCTPTPPYLQLLAMKLFSIVPHAASCERIWSICGWMVGKRRTRLSVSNLEAMTKIHSYYIANGKSELSNYGKDRTAEEIRKTLNDIHQWVEEENEDEHNESEMTGQMVHSDDDDIESQELEILNVLNLDLMFGNNSTDKELELDGLNDFIQELDNEEDFDSDLLVQNLNNNC